MRRIFGLSLLSLLYACTPRGQALYHHTPSTRFDPLVAAPAKMPRAEIDTNLVADSLLVTTLATDAYHYVPVAASKGERASPRSLVLTGPNKISPNRHSFNQSSPRESVVKRPAKTSGLSILSFFSAVASLFTIYLLAGPLRIFDVGHISTGMYALLILGLLGGVFAIVSGIKTLVNSKNDPKTRGRGFAIIGLLIGSIATLILTRLLIN